MATNIDLGGNTLIVNDISVGSTKPGASGTAISSSVSTTGSLTARSGTATPAAASAVAGVKMGSASIGIYWGTGSPNAAVTAAKGSLYLCTDGSSTSTRIYVNTDGSSAWTNVTTAA